MDVERRARVACRVSSVPSRIDAVLRQAVEVGQLLRRELRVLEGAEGVEQLGGAAGADEGAGDAGAGEEPRDGHLREGLAALLRVGVESAELFEELGRDGGGLQEAAAAGAYLHGLAGDRCKEKRGVRGTLPSDVVEELKEILKEMDRLL